MLERTPRNHSLPFAVFLMLGALLAFIRYNHGAYLKGIYDSLFSINLAQQLFRENRFRNPTANFLLAGMVVSVMGMLAFLLVRKYGFFTHIPDGAMLVLCILVTFLLYGGRMLMLKFIAFVLPEGNVFGFYAFNLNVYNSLLSIVLLPLLVLIAFANEIPLKIALLCMLVTILGFTVARSLRGFHLAGSTIRMHRFHFFLYLCTAEIAPMLIIYKVVLRTLGA